MKAKTHSGTKKRVKITATGKFRTAKIGKRHLLQNKSSQAKGRGKYGAATHVANERKMKWGHKVTGLRTPAKKTADGKIEKVARVAPKIKTVAKKVATPKVQKAPKTTAAKKTPAKKAAPKKTGK